jgi:8-oxo-dGTP diphosphatase
MPHIEFIARGVLSHGSKILLCRDVAGGYYYLPGGHVEFGESAGAAVVRELQEEGGLAAREGECLLVHENLFEARGRRHHEVNVVFHVKHDGDPEAIRSLEKEIELEWVEAAAVVDLDVRPSAIKAWLASGAQPCGWLSTIK